MTFTQLHENSKFWKCTRIHLLLFLLLLLFLFFLLTCSVYFILFLLSSPFILTSYLPLFLPPPFLSLSSSSVYLSFFLLLLYLSGSPPPPLPLNCFCPLLLLPFLSLPLPPSSFLPSFTDSYPLLPSSPHLPNPPQVIKGNPAAPK